MAPCGPFARDRRVAVAVSGGGDSMALAFLLRRWGEPVAFVVEHGLRAESAEEAALTMGRLAGMGIESRLLPLCGLRAGPGLGERARRARYAALLGACATAGLPDLFVAHHRQDQAETVLLRREAGSAAAGLAGMAAVSWRNEARLVRPLLTTAPERLRATLVAAGLHWVEDPTNRDPATARGRLRAAGVPEVDAAAPGRARAVAEAALASGLGSGVSVHPAGWAAVVEPLSEEGWAALIWTVSGRIHPPRREGVRGVQAACGGTLHGVRVTRGMVGREAAAMGRAVPATTGAVWDGRFVVRRTVEGAMLGGGGPGAGRLRRGRGAPSWIIETMPTLRVGMDLLMTPHLSYRGARTCPSVQVEFRPSRPLAGAPFVCVGCSTEGRGMHMGQAHPMSDES